MDADNKWVEERCIGRFCLVVTKAVSVSLLRKAKGLATTVRVVISNICYQYLPQQLHLEHDHLGDKYVCLIPTSQGAGESLFRNIGNDIIVR